MAQALSLQLWVALGIQSVKGIIRVVLGIQGVKGIINDQGEGGSPYIG